MDSRTVRPTVNMQGRSAARSPAVPPETIDDAPLTIDVASSLMGRLGFLAFRTPPGVRMPDSCLMVLIRDRPTLEHFDPEVVTYWRMAEGHGQPDSVDLSALHPTPRSFSWGRIQITDRLGMRNSFVTFGGQLSTEPMGAGALLAIFRSPAPILRLPGHSQRADRLAEEAMAFFGRLVPHLWSPSIEALVGYATPEVLWAAFLLDERDRLTRARGRLDGRGLAKVPVWRGLRDLGGERPEVLAAARQLLEAIASATPPGERPPQMW